MLILITLSSLLSPIHNISILITVWGTDQYIYALTKKKKNKVERTRHAVQLFRTGRLTSIERSGSITKPPDVPPRHAGLQLVDPNKVGKRGKAGSLRNRIAMLHALANIEQWAYVFDCVVYR